MADIYEGMWVNPMSTSSFASVKRDYVRDMAQKESYNDFFRNSTSIGSGGGTYGNVMAAADAQKEAYEKAAAERKAAAKKIANQAKKDTAASIKTAQTATEAATNALTPWRDAGLDALGMITEKIEAGPGEFTESPGYQFRLEEGQKALERSASARGNLMGTASQKAITRYAQDYATNDYDNFLRRYYESFDPLETQSQAGMQAAGRIGDYALTGSAQEIAARQYGTGLQTDAYKYSGESGASGIEAGANIIAATAAAEAERQYAYDAWQQGEDF